MSRCARPAMRPNSTEAREESTEKVGTDFVLATIDRHPPARVSHLSRKRRWGRDGTGLDPLRTRRRVGKRTTVARWEMTREACASRVR